MPNSATRPFDKNKDLKVDDLAKTGGNAFVSCGEGGSSSRFNPYFTASYCGDGVEARSWLPALVRVAIVGDSKVAEVEAFAFGSG